jgi:hypothetical protein
MVWASFVLVSCRCASHGWRNVTLDREKHYCWRARYDLADAISKQPFCRTVVGAEADFNRQEAFCSVAKPDASAS